MLRGGLISVPARIARGIRGLAVSVPKKPMESVNEIMASAMYRRPVAEKRPRLRRSSELLSAVAHSRNVKSSPWKLNMAAKMIRGKTVLQAMVQLGFSPKQHYAPIVQRCLQKAINLAEINHDLLPEQLRVAEVVVNKGRMMKKIRFHAKGRMGVMRKKWSNISVKLEEVDWDFEIASAPDEKAREAVVRLRKAVEARDMVALRSPAFRSVFNAGEKRKHLLPDAEAVLERERKRLGDLAVAVADAEEDQPPAAAEGAAEGAGGDEGAPPART